MKPRQMLIEGAQELGLSLSEKNTNDLFVYLEELKIWSKKINLTGLKEDEDIIINHFLDSLSIVKYVKSDSTLLDIGTGAGFPGVPVAIACLKCSVTCLDSSRRKITFVNNIVRKLGLKNIKTICGRAGQSGLNIQTYDFVVTRAVSGLSTVLRLSSSYLNESAKIVAMRGVKGKAELEDVSGELDDLGLAIDVIDEFKLPYSGAGRVNIIFKKNI